MRFAEKRAGVRSLLLGLDEGSVGTAGVAAAAFLRKKKIWINPDKIHRVIRDLKLAEGHCCNKLFEEAELWSAYLFGFNNRPFGSGTNSSLKKTLLLIFQVSETVDGHSF